MTTAEQYTFSVIRAIPDAMRGERVNVGIAVSHPNGRTTVHLAPDHHRLRHFDPALHVIEWDKWEREVNECLSSMPDTSHRYWLTHGLGPITADEAQGWFKADSEQALGDEIDLLIRRLIAPRHQESADRYVSTPPRPIRLRSQLKDWLKRQHVMGKSVDDLHNRRVVEHFPVSDETETFAEFAFRNGSINIMETLDLRNVTQLTERLRNEAAFKSVVLSEAKYLLDRGSKRIAVVAATDYGAVRSAVRMVEREADDVFYMEKPQDVTRLVVQISEALHLPSVLDADTLLAGYDEAFGFDPTPSLPPPRLR